MGWLDALYRHPFEGASARRYARDERPAFGDLDDRLLDALADRLAGARRLLDVGCGPQTFATRAVERFAQLSVIAVDPSRDYARRGAATVVRAAAEALPLADASIDVATCVSSIRHFRDRARALGELRRVVRPDGLLVIVELDPSASARRIANHADRLASRVLRHAFGPLVVKTAPRERDIVELASSHGWRLNTRHDDPVQPVYILELA